MIPPRPSASVHADSDERTMLCLACGFCCNGVLHTYTRVRASEAAALQRLSTLLYAMPDSAEYAFDQPCPHWQDQRCTIYPQRPQSCHDYECLLYKRLAAGLISPAESLGRLRKAQALLEQSDNLALESERAHHAALLHSYLQRHFEPDSLTEP